MSLSTAAALPSTSHELACSCSRRQFGSRYLVRIWTRDIVREPGKVGGSEDIASSYHQGSIVGDISPRFWEGKRSCLSLGTSGRVLMSSARCQPETETFATTDMTGSEGRTKTNDIDGTGRHGRHLGPLGRWVSFPVPSSTALLLLYPFPHSKFSGGLLVRSSQTRRISFCQALSGPFSSSVQVRPCTDAGSKWRRPWVCSRSLPVYCRASSRP